MTHHITQLLITYCHGLMENNERAFPTEMWATHPWSTNTSPAFLAALEDLPFHIKEDYLTMCAFLDIEEGEVSIEKLLLIAGTMLSFYRHAHALNNGHINA